MLTIEESQELIEEFIRLKQIVTANESKENKLAFKNHEKLCFEKFKYLITMRTYKYKTFSNYEDLNQEGMTALIKAMKNYNPKLGNFFWWCHKYIETRISRSANLHTAIRYPLKFTKTTIPHKESDMPLLIDDSICSEKKLENAEVIASVKHTMSSLNNEQKQIINWFYGLNGEKSLSINKISKKLDISRLNCIRSIDYIINIIKENIKI